MRWQKPRRAIVQPNQQLPTASSSTALCSVRETHSALASFFFLLASALREEEWYKFHEFLPRTDSILDNKVQYRCVNTAQLHAPQTHLKDPYRVQGDLPERPRGPPWVISALEPLRSTSGLAPIADIERTSGSDRKVPIADIQPELRRGRNRNTGRSNAKGLKTQFRCGTIIASSIS